MITGPLRIAVGADHAGYRRKQALVQHLRALGHDVDDLGAHGEERCDYPPIAGAVAVAVAEGAADVGICVCGTGVGMSIAANKVPGVRAALVHDVTTARLARQHNDANVLCLGARVVGEQVAADAVEVFLGTAFDGGRHAGRVEQIHDLEPHDREGSRR